MRPHVRMRGSRAAVLSLPVWLSNRHCGPSTGCELLQDSADLITSGSSDWLESAGSRGLVGSSQGFEKDDRIHRSFRQNLGFSPVIGSNGLSSAKPGARGLTKVEKEIS